VWGLVGGEEDGGHQEETVAQEVAEGVVFFFDDEGAGVGDTWRGVSGGRVEGRRRRVMWDERGKERESGLTGLGDHGDFLLAIAEEEELESGGDEVSC